MSDHVCTESHCLADSHHGIYALQHALAYPFVRAAIIAEHDKQEATHRSMLSPEERGDNVSGEETVAIAMEQGPDSPEWQLLDDIIAEGLEATMDGHVVTVEYDEGAIYAKRYTLADEWVCGDCACWIANADLSGLDYEDPEAAEEVRKNCDALPDGCLIGDCGDGSATKEAGPFDECSCCGRGSNRFTAYGYFSQD